ncbi:hypothetical protein ACSSS7_003486 [Eimeria intestinalis]
MRTQVARIGYKRPSVLLPLVALGAVVYQAAGAVGSLEPNGTEGHVQNQPIPRSAESRSFGSVNDQAHHEAGGVLQLAGTLGEKHRMMQEQANVGQSTISGRNSVNADDDVAPAKRELAGSPPQGPTRLGNYWSEKLLRKEFKRVSEAIEQLQSPSSRAELYERLEQKINQARFEGAISPDDEFVDTDANDPPYPGDEFDDCGYLDEPRPSRRPVRGPHTAEQAEGNYSEITRPTRPNREDELIEEPTTGWEEGGRRHHPSRRPRHRRRTAVERSGQSFDGVQASDTAWHAEGEEEEQALQEEQKTDLAQDSEADADEHGVEGAGRAHQASNKKVESHAEDRAPHNQASEEGGEGKSEVRDEGGHSDTDGDGESYNETHERNQARGSEAMSEEEARDRAAHEHQYWQDESLTEELPDQEPQKDNQAWDAEVQPDHQTFEETHEPDQNWEEEVQHVGRSNQDVHEADQIVPNEAGNEEQSFDGTKETQELDQAEQSENEADEQSTHEASIGHEEAQAARQSFRQTRQRKPAMPSGDDLQKVSYSETYEAAEPVRYAAEAQGGAHRQTQRGSARRRREPDTRAEVVVSNEAQRRGPVRRHVGSGSEDAVRHVRRGHVRSNESQSQRQGPRQAQRTSQARQYENDTPKQSSRPVQLGVQVAQGGPAIGEDEDEDTTKEVLSYALREAEKLEQMANKMKHLYAYVVEQEGLTRTAATVASSRSSPKPTSREALEKMIEQDIDNLLDSFRTLLNYAKEVQHTEETQERRWEAPTTFSAPSPPQLEGNRMQRNEAESSNPQQVRPPTQRVRTSRSTSAPDRSVPHGRGSTGVSRSSNAPPRRRVPTSSASNNGRTREDAIDLTYKILDNYGNSNITVRALQDVKDPLEAGHDATESSTFDEELGEGSEEGHSKEGDAKPQEVSTAGDIAALTDHEENLVSVPAAPTRTLSMVDDAVPHSLTTANTKEASTVAGMDMDGDSKETSLPEAQSATGDEKREVEESQKTGTPVFYPYHAGTEGSSEPASDSNTDGSESSALRNLAGVRKRTKFNQASVESSDEEASTEPVFPVTPFVTSSSRPPPAGPPERWAGAYTIRLSPRVSGMSRSSDGTDYPNTPYRTYRSYANPFSSAYSTHSFHEDYGKRYSNSYYHDNPPRTAISWKEFVRRREEKKALEKRKQEEANEPKLGVIETEPPKEVGIINVNTRRSNLRSGTPTQVHRPYTPMRPPQTRGSQTLSGANRTRVSFTPYSSVAAAQGVTAF